MRCRICREEFLVITNTHVSLHGLSLKEYRKRFPRQRVGFSVNKKSLRGYSSLL